MKFDPWRASNWSLELACRQDKKALCVFFLAGYVRVNQASLGGEDTSQMRENYITLLKTLGDKTFAKILAAQRPEIRSAASWHLSGEDKLFKSYPKTKAVLDAAEKIEWPVDIAYKENK